MSAAVRNRACYTGREFFGRLDQDGDNKVTVEDVKSVMRQRKLPESYAMQFISAARGNRWWSNSIRCAERAHLSSSSLRGVHLRMACPLRRAQAL